MVRVRRSQAREGLTPVMFQILLALTDGDSHGYAIMKSIEERTGGDMELGAGTLYRSLKQLMDQDFIAEVKPRTVVHRQRRSYRLTPAGRKLARREAEKLAGLVEWARSADLLDPHGA
jgi:DNA-binding PadR family transcriptional regulator